MTALVSLALVLHGAVTTVNGGDDWPCWRGPQKDGTWNESGLLDAFPDHGLKVTWRADISAGYTGPTVADGRVYVMDRIREPDSRERVHCFDQAGGRPLWTHEYICDYVGVGYEAGPRASVLIHDGRAYSLGSMGNFFCLDATSGEVLWAKNLDELYDIQMPIWGVSASPVLEGDKVLVVACGTDACLVAFDRVTGEECWKAVPDRGNYSTPIVVDQAGKRVIVLWTGDRVVGVDTSDGKELWSHPFKAKQMPLGCASPVLAGDKLFFSGFYDGCLLLQLDTDKTAVTEVWRRKGQNERSTDGLHSIISTPLILGDFIYGVDAYGQFRCLSMEDGERLWEDDTAVPRARWATIHFVQNDDLTWMFNERGELIVALLSSDGFDEIDRAQLIQPTREQLNQREGVCWSHPAFAGKHVFIRNDKELICASLAR